MAVMKASDGGEEHRTLKTDPCTVFVRNLPFNLNDEQLEEAFGEVGPTRKCFIVKQKGADGEAKSRGFAFVQFALKEDADRAVTQKNGAKLLGRVLAVSSAQKRVPLEQRKTTFDQRQKEAHKDKLAGGETATDQAEAEPSKKSKEPATASKEKVKPTPAPVLAANGAPPVASRDNELARHRPNRQVVVGGLVEDTAKTGGVPKKLALLVARKAGLLEATIVPAPEEELEKHKVMADGCPAGLTMLLTYTSVKDARAAVVKLHGATKFKGKSSGALWARQLGGEGALLKRWKLIVRNLSFKVTETELRDAFKDAAFVWDVLMPLSADKKSKGFAFVTFTCRADAELAIAKVNGTEVGGRPVAVDWALSKKDFQEKLIAEEPAANKPPKAAVAAVRDGLSDDDDSDSDSDADFDVQESESDEEEEAPGAAAKKKARTHVTAAETDMLSRIMGNLLGEGEEEEAAEAEEDAKPAKKDKTSKKTDEKVKGKEAAIEGKKGKQADSKPAAHMGTVTEAPKEDGGQDDDNPDARTVFVRNVPAEATQALMREKLEKFGRVRACRLVRDGTTGRLKGTAFVEFAAVAAVLAPALNQKEARKLAGELRGGKGGKDSRNLYLAKEGEIDPEGDAAVGLSKLDLQRRAASKAEKESKLKSPNFFVSDTRLSVHNLPLKTDDKALKKIFMDAVQRRATKEVPVVKQAKVLRDKERKDEDGNLRSKGMGFVEFAEHSHAIAALRELNNNPTIFSKDRRPIVEFAIEDVKILKLREKRARLIAQQLAPKEPKQLPFGGKDYQGGDKKRAAEEAAGADSKRQRTEGGDEATEGKKFKMGSKERKRLREEREVEGGGEEQSFRTKGDLRAAKKAKKAPKEAKEEVKGNAKPAVAKEEGLPVGYYAKQRAAKAEAAGAKPEAEAKDAGAKKKAKKVEKVEGKQKGDGVAKAEGAAAAAAAEGKKGGGGGGKGSQRAAAEGKLDGLVADYRAKYDLGGVKAKPKEATAPLQERGRWFE